jgi:glyoxylase-like metal-dependent hydrolase (beta-lactamase superfamily II)
MIQKTLPVGQLMCNCQILVCPQTHSALIVDPGDEAHRILGALSEIEDSLKAKIQVKALFHTHAHFDHIGASREVKEHFLNAGIEAPHIYLHQADEFIYSMLPQQAGRFGFKMKEPLPVDRYFEDGQKLAVGTLKFTILHTPGHSPGGVCFHLHSDSGLQIPEMVFTGDTLFRASIGRADLWGGDEALLVKSIRERLFTLDDDTCAWPGHGPSTTIGYEKRNNPYVQVI